MNNGREPRRAHHVQQREQEEQPERRHRLSLKLSRSNKEERKVAAMPLLCSTLRLVLPLASPLQSRRDTAELAKREHDVSV